MDESEAVAAFAPYVDQGRGQPVDKGSRIHDAYLNCLVDVLTRRSCTTYFIVTI